MGDPTVQVPLPNISADLIAHLNDALDQVHTASYHLDAHAGEISALLSQTSTVTAEVTSSNQGQFVSALQALWSGSHASSGVAADGQHAVALLQTTTSALNTLPPVFAAQMPAITAGMAAIAQLQAARSTLCYAQPQQHPQPSLTQDQISALLGQVNALLAALQAFNGPFFTAAATISQFLGTFNPAVCASGLSPDGPNPLITPANFDSSDTPPDGQGSGQGGENGGDDPPGGRGDDEEGADENDHPEKKPLPTTHAGIVAEILTSEQTLARLFRLYKEATGPRREMLGELLNRYRERLSDLSSELKSRYGGWKAETDGDPFRIPADLSNFDSETTIERDLYTGFQGYNLDSLAVRADELRDQMAAVERRMPVDRSAPEWPWLNTQKTLIHKALLGADIRLETLKLQELEMRSDLFSLLNHGEVDDELIRAMRDRQREIDYYTNAYKRIFKEPPPL